jgi:hypothetical protein
MISGSLHCFLRRHRRRGRGTPARARRRTRHRRRSGRPSPCGGRRPRTRGERADGPRVTWQPARTGGRANRTRPVRLRRRGTDAPRRAYAGPAHDDGAASDPASEPVRCPRRRTSDRGANSALVDAAVLLDELCRAVILPRALAACHARRRPSVRRVADFSSQLGRLAEATHPVVLTLRGRLLLPAAALLTTPGTASIVLQESAETLRAIGCR